MEEVGRVYRMQGLDQQQRFMKLIDQRGYALDSIGGEKTEQTSRRFSLRVRTSSGLFQKVGTMDCTDTQYKVETDVTIQEGIKFDKFLRQFK